MRAVIDWMTKEQGGRREPPLGLGDPPYSPIVRFVDEPWPPKDAWSLTVRKRQDLGGPYRWLADVNYRVEEAPHDTLREGREFELYEGKQCVARGTIVEDSWALTATLRETTSV